MRICPNRKLRQKVHWETCERCAGTGNVWHSTRNEAVQKCPHCEGCGFRVSNIEVLDPGWTTPLFTAAFLEGYGDQLREILEGLKRGLQ